MAQRNILLMLPVFCLISCQSKKAADLNTALLDAERAAFNIIVGKDGPNERKLKCFIDGDFKCARQAVDEKELAFNQIINKIEVVETSNIEYGNDLKKAAINYYDALKQLEIADRREIALQQLSQDKTITTQLRDSIIVKQGQLLNQKLEMRKFINKKENKLAEIQKQFKLAKHLN